MELKDGLTILIPTYNRQERLLNTLRSIFSQGHWGEYMIVIVDNCSNYNVEDIIITEFPESFTRNIRVHRWFFNTGMSTNISIAFEFVDTKWCWFISDDDEILEGALNTVLKDTKRMEKIAAIKYSITDICTYDNSIIQSVDDWASYYIAHLSGDMGYLSMLYNISILYPYLQELTIHSYSYLSFWLPVIRALNESDAGLIMSSDVLFRYQNNNDGWSSTYEKYLNTLLGIRTLFDFKYGLSQNTYCKFKKVFVVLFDTKSIVKRIVLLPDKHMRVHYYNLLKNYISGRVFDVCLSKVLYHIVIIFNIPPYILKKILFRGE